MTENDEPQTAAVAEPSMSARGLPVRINDLGGLELFTAVVESGSVGRAARLLGISQPAASTRLTNLERQLGVTLLERGPTGSQPTDDGRLVADWTAPLLDAARRLAVSIDALRAGADHRARIMASYTIAEYLLPTWLARFQRSTPGHRAELLVANSQTVISAIRSGDVDLGFVETDGELNDLGQEPVGTDRLIVVAAPDHPWCRPGRQVQIEELLSTPLVLRERGSGTRDRFENALADLGMGRPIPSLELGSTSAVKSAVGGGVGPGVLSDLTVANDLSTGSLVSVDVPGLHLGRELRMIWATDRALSGTARLFRDQMVS